MGFEEEPQVDVMGRCAHTFGHMLGIVFFFYVQVSGLKESQYSAEVVMPPVCVRACGLPSAKQPHGVTTFPLTSLMAVLKLQPPFFHFIFF